MGSDFQGNPIPPIPPVTFVLSDVLDSFFPISWNLERITSIQMSFFNPVEKVGLKIGDAQVQMSWPLEYAVNESAPQGYWKRVPETGGTLLLFALSGMAIFCIHSLRERRTL